MPAARTPLLVGPLSLLALVLAASACGDADGHDDEASAAFSDAWNELRDEKADSSCSGVVVPDRGPFLKKVALTFDDGPNPETTPQVMATLRRHNAPATFFINGNRVNSATTRAIVKEMVDDPLFTLANHTRSHENMARLSLEDAIVQIDESAAVITAAGGTNTYFRFPFGSSTCETMQLVKDRGLRSTGWHIDSADWCFSQNNGECKESTFAHVPDDFRKDMGGFVMSQVRRSAGGVVLFHDIHRSTERSLEGILTQLEAEGFEFTTLDDTTSFPLLNGVERAFIGDPCELDTDCNFAGGFCMPEASGGYCTQECETSCPDREGFATTRCVVPPVDVSADFTVCALSCTAESCREGLECQSAIGSNGLARSVCF